MKKISFLSAFIMLSFALFGQDIIIRFTGSGEASEVSSVEVKNLSNGTSITVPDGNNSLNLTQGTLGIKEIQNTENIIISNYPNPFENSTTIEFYIEQDENITITITDITGKVIVNKCQKLNKGAHSFEFTGGNMGTYFIKVSGINFTSTSKIVCSGNNSNQANLIYNGQVTKNYKQENSPNGSKNFSFTVGDTLLLKGFSGNYATIMVVMPTASTTYTFEFVPCQDYDGNNYAVVKIGTQTWMAENLKAIHYPNGNAIPHVIIDSIWVNLADNNIDDAYCYYNNNTSNECGALYTYAAAIADDWQKDNSSTDSVGGQGVCPDGWHLPTDAEWQELVDYLGGSSVAGGKLKETGTTHWDSPNTDATNESGFTALPGGYRNYYDGWLCASGYYGCWWSASEDISTNSWFRLLHYANADIYRYSDHKSNGYSVRCIKD